MKVDRATEFSIYLHDRPGALAGILDAMVGAGVQVQAVYVAEHNSRGLVRVVGTPDADARSVCDELCDAGAGPVAEAEVLVVQCPDRPLALREIAMRLAETNVNIRYAYHAPADNGTPALCVLRLDDTDSALEPLSNL